MTLTPRVVVRVNLVGPGLQFLPGSREELWLGASLTVRVLLCGGGEDCLALMLGGL